MYSYSNNEARAYDISISGDYQMNNSRTVYFDSGLVISILSCALREPCDNHQMNKLAKKCTSFDSQLVLLPVHTVIQVFRI